MRDRIRDAISRREAVLLVCRCTVRYAGRAESSLAEGDRIVLIKPDSTLLVHQPTGSAPVNYMKAGAVIDVLERDGRTIIQARLGKERMDIEIAEIHSFSSHELLDPHGLVLNGSEKDMADMLYAHPRLIEPGFKPLSREEHTKAGFIDLFGYDQDNILTVVECKRYSADQHAVDQLRRYVERIRESRGLAHVRGILACPKVSASAQRLLESYGFSYVCVEPPSYFKDHKAGQTCVDNYR